MFVYVSFFYKTIRGECKMYEEFEDRCDLCGEFKRVADTPEGLLCLACYAPGVSIGADKVVSFEDLNDGVKEAALHNEFNVGDCL